MADDFPAELIAPQQCSTLECFPPQVSTLISKSLIGYLTENNHASVFKTEQDLQWTLQVIEYGLKLSGSDFDTLRASVTLCTDWLTVISSNPKDGIPQLIKKNPHFYSQKIIHMLHYAFAPRISTSDGVTKSHALLCDYIIGALTSLCTEHHYSIKLKDETWNSIILFFLKVTHTLQRSLPKPGELAFQICEHQLSSMFQVWLLACNCCFPSDKYWLAFQYVLFQCSSNINVANHWRRALLLLFGSTLNGELLIIQTEKEREFTKQISSQCISRTWFRIFQSFVLPSYFAKAERIVESSKLKFSLKDEFFFPLLFHKVVQTVCWIVYAMSGLSKNEILSRSIPSSLLESLVDDPLPSNQKRLKKGSGVKSSEKPLLEHLICPTALFPYKFNRSKLRKHSVNTILSIFGDWLFGSVKATSDWADCSSSTYKDFQIGRAEALIALIHLFGSIRNDEMVEEVFLNKFFLSLKYGLAFDKNNPSGVSILQVTTVLHSTSLYFAHLPGFNCLIPNYLNTVEAIFSKKIDNSVTKSSYFVMSDVICASLLWVQSVVALPTHFNRSNPSAINDSSFCKARLGRRLCSILLPALNEETNVRCLQIILNTLSILLSDKSFISKLNADSQQTMHTEHLISNACSSVLCKLTTKWAEDNNLSVLAYGLGFIRRMAGLNVKADSQIVVKDVCNLICKLMFKPNTSHSKELHSVLVSAYYTLSTWIVAQPSLVESENVMDDLMGAIELGISGSLSAQDAHVVLKHEKEFKPASQRVKDSAEMLLHIFLQNGLSNTVNEHSSSLNFNEKTIFPSFQPREFEYIILEKSFILISLLPGSNNGEEPSVTAIIRTAFGKFLWNTSFVQFKPNQKFPLKLAFQLRSRQKKCLRSQPSFERMPKFFPSEVERFPITKCENAIQTIDSLQLPLSDHCMLDILRGAQQTEQNFKLASADWVPPPEDFRSIFPLVSVQPIRLLLSHLTFFTDDSTNKSDELFSRNFDVTPLDKECKGFFTDLEALDELCERQRDLVKVFYVGSRSKQSVNDTNMNEIFASLFYTIGCPFDLQNRKPSKDFTPTCNISVFDGVEFALATFDVFEELYFFNPKHTHNYGQQKCLDCQSRSMSSKVDVLLFLIESNDDIQVIDQAFCKTLLSNYKCLHCQRHSRDRIVFCVSLLPSALFQIYTFSTFENFLMYPLSDGMIISPVTLSTLLVATLRNAFYQYRLDYETWQPCHVRRRQKLLEIVTKYSKNLDDVDVLGWLLNTLGNFSHPSNLYNV